MEGYTYEYLPWRGVTASTFQLYTSKTKIGSDGRPISIGFQYGNGRSGEAHWYKVRDLEKKTFYTTGTNHPGLFGIDKFEAGTHKYLTITEGELDACSLYQVLKTPVVSVQSASSAGRDVAHSRSQLSGYERVYLCFDNDAAGREATANVAKLFDYNKVYHVKLNKYKDANDYLQAGEGEELRNLWWNAKKYLPETIISSFVDFDTILTTTSPTGIPYPWLSLTEMTYGLRRSESVLLTAQEGVGKTELMHAIEYQLLKRTQDNVGAIYLEEPKRRHLQAIAGLELGKRIHLPDVVSSSDEVATALRNAIGMDDRLHVYSHFGSDDPEVLLDTIRFMVSARDVRWVLLDHVSMAVSGLQGEDERRALDYIATRLEMMVKELNFGLVMVSHVNDLGQTRGSRYLSKIADVRIDATRDILNPDDNIRNITALTVSKNRFSGKTGAAGLLRFDPVTGKYEEIEVANDNQPVLGTSDANIRGILQAA